MPRLPTKISSIPFFGSVFEYAKDPLKYYERLQSLEKPIVYDKLFGKYFYIVFDGNLIDEIFIKNSKNYEKNKFLKSFSDFFGEGLLTSDGARWRQDRKIIQPSFNRNKISLYSERMLVESQSFIKKLDGKSEIKVMQTMTQMTLGIFLNAVLGIELDEEIYQSVLQTTTDCNEYLAKSSNPLGFMISKLPTSDRRKYLGGIKSFEKIIYKIIDQKKIDINNGIESNDLITSLLRSRDEEGNPLDLVNLRDQVMTFLVAGHETSALTLSFAFHVLASRSDIQTKLYNELILAFPDGKIDLNQLNDVTYLNQFINETLRYYPTSWMIGRDALEEAVVGDFIITKGAMVTLPIWAIHRNAKYYNEPLIFNPERWTKDFEAQLPKHAFVPFGYGPRVCIGQAFAMNEFRISIASILLNYKFTIIGPLELEVTTLIMARPKHDFLVSVKPRSFL
ncbi:MAG: cytochrome P450 [Bacteriovorax sp.]|nr:cytochrome P450 [Bacteriovorax sp.]